MPHGGPGQLLRAVRGHREALLNGDGVRIFARGPGDDSGPALVGTRFHLVASQLIDSMPAGGTVRVSGAFNERHYRSFQPAVPWGTPGRLARTPRSAVLVIPGMQTDYATPYVPINRLVWANALADGIGAGVSDLVAAGVHVYLVNGGGGGAGGDGAAGSNPLIGPMYLLESSTFEFTEFSDANILERYSVVPAVNATDAIGGDVWWGYAGFNHRGDFGGYETEGTFVEPGGVSAHTFTTDGILTSLGSDFAAGVSSTTLELFLWTPPFDRDAALLAAVARRCRSFRWAWVNNNTAVGLGGASVLADESVAMSRMPAATNAAFISESTGAATAAAVLADWRNFFNL